MPRSSRSVGQMSMTECGSGPLGYRGMIPLDELRDPTVAQLRLHLDALHAASAAFPHDLAVGDDRAVHPFRRIRGPEADDVDAPPPRGDHVPDGRHGALVAGDRLALP